MGRLWEDSWENCTTWPFHVAFNLTQSDFALLRPIPQSSHPCHPLGLSIKYGGAWCWWPGHLFNPEITSWGLNCVIPDWFGVRVRQITIAYGIKAIWSTDNEVSLLYKRIEYNFALYISILVITVHTCVCYFLSCFSFWLRELDPRFQGKCTKIL